MGTRSVIAVPHEGAWRGRYCHWDGYPSGVGVALLEIRRAYYADSLSAMVHELTVDHRYWSTLTGPDSDLNDHGDPRRFKPETGLGVAGIGDDMPDEWIYSTGDNWGTEWAYVLDDPGIAVLEATRDLGHAVGMFGSNDGAAWKYRGFVPWFAPNAVDLMRSFDQ